MDKPTRPELDPADYENVDIDDEDNPEWTEADFVKARPLRDVLPHVHEALARELGKTRKAG